VLAQAARSWCEAGRRPKRQAPKAAGGEELVRAAGPGQQRERVGLLAAQLL